MNYLGWLILFTTYYIHVTLSALIIKKPSNGTGAIEISVEDVEHYYYNPDRLLFVFNRSCAQKINESNNYDKIQEYIDKIKNTYSKCIKLTNNTANITHYDTNSYSYVFFDLLCSIVSLQQDQNSNLSINYNDLCIEYIIYEPLFNISQTIKKTNTLNSTATSTEEYYCMRQNTAYYKSYGLDLLDSHDMDYTYSYPQFTNVSIANKRKIDIHILDSGIQSDHIEFDDYQVIHQMGDGPTTDGDGSSMIYGDHGTHVAGIAAGKNYGAAKNFTIYDYRVCVFTPDGQDMPCYGSFIFEALFMVYQQIQTTAKPAVINLSLGGYKSTPMNDAYQYYFEALNQVGGIPVVAAGNEDVDACSTSPAYCSNAITVGSYDRKGKKSYFSNWGNCVDIWAPGSSIYSAIASGKNDKYEYKSGTSMASPYITGMVANLLYVDPTLRFDDIKEVLLMNTYSVSGDECDEYDCKQAQYKCASALIYDLPYQWTTMDIIFIGLGCIGLVVIVIICIICWCKRT